MPERDDPNPTQDPVQGGTMSLGEHLEELRRRLIFAVIGLIPILIGALVVGKWLLAILIAPLAEELAKADLAPQLQAVSPTETFNNYLKVSFVSALVVGAPWLVAQGWLFVAPGLYNNERRFAYLLAPLSILLTTLSVLFLYYVILPVILAFFIAFGSNMPTSAPDTGPWPDGVPTMTVPIVPLEPTEPTVGQLWFNSTMRQLRLHTPDGVLGVPMVADALVAQQYRVHEHVKFVLNLAIAFAISFQMPVVVLLLGWAGIIEPKTLAKYRRHAIMVLCVLGAFLTPADPLSMVLLAGPLYLLYELGMLLLRIFPAWRVAGSARPGSTRSDGDTDGSDS